MGWSDTSWFMILFFFSYFYSTSGQSNQNLSRDSLDTLLQDYVFKSLSFHPRTGTLYKVPIPSNFSGIEVSVARERSGSLWLRGVYFNEINISTRVIAMPFVRRLDIVYHNLGNWSDSYYNVPGFTMVTPVVGFFAYNASDMRSNYIKLNLSVMAEPISVHFSKLSLPEGINSTNTTTFQCVRFAQNGTIDFSEMALNNVCFTKQVGHYAIVVPSVEPKTRAKKKVRLWKWLVAGFVLGFAALVALGLIGIGLYKFVKMKKIKKMEKRADEGESFDTIWIGMSKMPSATVIRTQPVLELEEIP